MPYGTSEISQICLNRLEQGLGGDRGGDRGADPGGDQGEVQSCVICSKVPSKFSNF